MATRDYTLGKGKITFVKDDTASLAVLAAGGFADLGNAPAMAVSLATEKLEHQSSRDGIGLVDASVITKTSATGSFTLDEPNADNLAMFFMDPAAAAASSSPVVVQAVQKSLFTATNVWYPVNLVGGAVVKTPGTISADSQNLGTGYTVAYHGTPGTQTADITTLYEIRVAAEGASGAATIVARANGGAWTTTPMVVTNAASLDLLVGADVDTGLNLALGTIANAKKGDIWSFTVSCVDPVGLRVTDITAFVCDAKVSGTDYMLDAASGLVMFLTTPGVITTCTVSGQSGNKSTVDAFTTSQMKGWIYYVANPAAGVPIDVIGYCRISPTGDLALIGTDWTQMQFSVDFLKVDGFPIVKIETRAKV